MKNLAALILLMSLVVTECRAQFLDETRRSDQNALSEEALDKLLNAQWPPVTYATGDTVAVQVYGVKDYALQKRIEEDGYIALPLIGKIHIAGFTELEAEMQIAVALSKAGMVHDPQVTVNSILQPTTIVTVSGDVPKPGVFPAGGHLTLIDFLSQAGGLTETAAAGSTSSAASPIITLVRPGLLAPIRIPLGPNPMLSPYAKIPIFPHDEIRVARTGMVYAVGAFKNQGAYALKNTGPTTAMQLVAMAGGVTFQAKLSEVYIVRTENNQKLVNKVNLVKAREGKDIDFELKSEDILFVPNNRLRSVLANGGTGAVTGMAVALAYRF